MKNTERPNGHLTTLFNGFKQQNDTGWVSLYPTGERLDPIQQLSEAVSNLEQWHAVPGGLPPTYTTTLARSMRIELIQRRLCSLQDEMAGEVKKHLDRENNSGTETAQD